MSSEEDGYHPGVLAAAALAVCAVLVFMGQTWPQYFSPNAAPFDLSLLAGGKPPANAPQYPLFEAAWVELAKLIAAAGVGMLVTSVYRQYHGDRAPNRSLMQAAVLLCLSGALMMMIIGNSTARALGIAGGASIIRFRTPVDDPKDAIMLFLVLGLGMSLGLGGFAVCGLATLFLCVFLAVLDRFGEFRPRVLMLDLVATTKDFPLEHVRTVLGAHTRSYEPLKVVQGGEAAMRFSVKVDQGASLAWLSEQLMARGNAGLKSISWEQPKRFET
ncbi:MAG: DUF4956 domain-containing protein [Bryobacteraceae bacterium]|nr:DUF4956 domain-containing protein [Bryobacteraceae bacterium]